MNRGGNDVVRALAHVDVIVGMHGNAGVAAGEVRDHLVGIHVGAGAGAGLEDVEREVRVVTAFRDFQRRLLDGRSALGIQAVEVEIRGRRRPLDQAERADELARHAQAADRKVLDRALRLRAPQRVGRHLQLAEAVSFRSETLVRHSNLCARNALILRYYSTKHEQQRAQRHLPYRRPLRRQGRRAAAAVQRARADPPAGPRRSVVAQGAGRRARHRRAARPAGRRADGAGCAGRRADRGRGRRGQAHRARDQSRCEGSRVLRQGAARLRAGLALATRVRALRLHVGGHQQSQLCADAARRPRSGAAAPPRHAHRPTARARARQRCCADDVAHAWPARDTDDARQGGRQLRLPPRRAAHALRGRDNRRQDQWRGRQLQRAHQRLPAGRLARARPSASSSRSGWRGTRTRRRSSRTTGWRSTSMPWRG